MRGNIKMKIKIFVLMLLLVLAPTLVFASDLSLSLDSIHKDSSKIEFYNPTKDISSISKSVYVLKDDVAFFKDKSAYDVYTSLVPYSEIEYYDCKIETIGKNSTEVCKEREVIKYKEVNKVAKITLKCEQNNQLYSVFHYDGLLSSGQEYREKGSYYGSYVCKNNIISFDVDSFSGYGVTQAQLLDGLVSYWKMDETSGTTASDSHGSNNGTLSNSRIFGTDGKINKGADFTQGNDYIDLNFVPTTDSAFTWLAWVKRDGNPPSSSEPILSSNSGSTQGISSFIQTDGAFRVFAGEGTSTRNLGASTTTVTDNNWYHVVLTFNGTTGKMYVNGNEEVSESWNPYSSTINLLLGKRGSLSIFGNHLIDEVGIWNRALNSTEIKGLYDAQVDGFSYPFDIVQNVSITAHDVYLNTSIKEFNFTLNGTFYEVTNYSIVTHLLDNDTNIYSIDLSVDNLYFDDGNYSFNASDGSFEFELYQKPLIKLNDTNLDAFIQTFNVSVCGNNYYTNNYSVQPLCLSNRSLLYDFYVDGLNVKYFPSWFNDTVVDEEFIVFDIDTKPVVRVKDADTSLFLSSWSIWVDGVEFPSVSNLLYLNYVGVADYVISKVGYHSISGNENFSVNNVYDTFELSSVIADPTCSFTTPIYFNSAGNYDFNISCSHIEDLSYFDIVCDNGYNDSVSDINDTSFSYSETITLFDTTSCEFIIVSSYFSQNESYTQDFIKGVNVSGLDFGVLCDDIYAVSSLSVDFSDNENLTSCTLRNNGKIVLTGVDCNSSYNISLYDGENNLALYGFINDTEVSSTCMIYTDKMDKDIGSMFYLIMYIIVLGIIFIASRSFPIFNVLLGLVGSFFGLYLMPISAVLGGIIILGVWLFALIDFLN